MNTRQTIAFAIVASIGALGIVAAAGTIAPEARLYQATYDLGPTTIMLYRQVPDPAKPGAFVSVPDIEKAVTGGQVGYILRVEPGENIDGVARDADEWIVRVHKGAKRSSLVELSGGAS